MSEGAKRIPASSQTVGPYFRIGLQYLIDQTPAPSTEPDENVEIRGRVLDRDRVPVTDAILEFWSGRGVGRACVGRAAENGIPEGFRRVATDENGGFAAVIARPDADKSEGEQYFVVLVFARGLLRHLITRVYLGDEAKNENDPVLQLVPAERRSTLIARADGKQAGLYRWDIVLQGTSETVFFAW